MEEKNCRFCNILNGKLHYGDIDNPLFVNDDYFSLASIGALVPGWTLIVPKMHVYNMSEYYNHKDFIEYVDVVAKKVVNGTEKNIVFFEHGANHCDSLTGCGTNHAHLHLVPYSKSIYELDISEKKWESCNVTDVKKITSGKEYLLCGDYNDKLDKSQVLVSIVDNPESQYFRKKIAEDMNILDQYDYKKNINEYNTRLTIDILNR